MQSVPLIPLWVTYLCASLRDALWFRFELGHKHTAFCTKGQPSHGTPNGDTANV